MCVNTARHATVPMHATHAATAPELFQLKATRTFWLQCDGLHCTTAHAGAGNDGIARVFTARQEAHVKQFLCTEAAFQDGTAAQQQVQECQANASR